MTDTPARTDVPGRAEAAQREPSLHERAVSEARTTLENAEHFQTSGVACPVAELRYTLAVLTAFQPMRAALDNVEWSRSGGYCPECDEHKDDGHYEDCPLAAALRAARAVEQP